MTKKWKRWLSGLLALCSLGPLARGALAAPVPGTNNGAPPGENGYVSLHKYVSKTNQEGIYRVQLEVEGILKPKPLLVTFVLDYSSSMRETPTANHPEDRYFRWTGEGLRHALDVLADPQKNPAYDHTYLNIIAYGRTPVAVNPPAGSPPGTPTVPALPADNFSYIEIASTSLTEVWEDKYPGPLTETLPAVTGWWPGWTDDSYGYKAYLAGYNTGHWSGFSRDSPQRNIKINTASAPTGPLTTALSGWPTTWAAGPSPNYDANQVEINPMWTAPRSGDTWSMNGAGTANINVVSTKQNDPFVKLVDASGAVRREVMGPALLFEHSMYMHADFDPYSVSGNPVTYWKGPINAPRPIRVESGGANDGYTLRMGTSTWMGAGLYRAYHNLNDLRSAPPDANYNDFDDYNNFVMIMTDGSDSDGFTRRGNVSTGAGQFVSAYWPLASSQGYALALKAPSKYSVRVDFNEDQAMNPPATLRGTNANIWSLLLEVNANAHKAGYERFFFNWPAVQAAAGIGNPPSSVHMTPTVWPYGRRTENIGTTTDEGRTLQEINMVTLAAPLKIDETVVNAGVPLNDNMTAYSQMNMLKHWLYFYAEDATYGTPGVSTHYDEAVPGGVPSSTTPNQVELVTNPTRKDEYTPYFYCNSKQLVLDAFDSFAIAAGAFGGNPRVEDKLGAHFDIHQMQGKPLLEVTGDGADQASIDQNGLIHWPIKEIKHGERLTLTYYVKMKGGTNPDLYYEANAYAYISYSYTDENDVTHDVVKYFSVPYVSPGGEVKNEEAPAEIASPPGEPEAEALPPSFIAQLDSRLVEPPVMSSALGSWRNGRLMLKMELNSHTKYRYQWQMETEDGWQDIFGATSSVYTSKAGDRLNTVDPATDKVTVRKLTQGKEYHFRCIVTDPASNCFISQELRVKVEGKAKNEKLAERLNAITYNKMRKLKGGHIEANGKMG